MRKMFGLDSPKLPESRQGATPATQVPEDDLFEDEDWEDQADKLYEWTQNLSLDELGVTSSWCSTIKKSWNKNVVKLRRKNKKVRNGSGSKVSVQVMDQMDI